MWHDHSLPGEPHHESVGDLCCAQLQTLHFYPAQLKLRFNTHGLPEKRRWAVGSAARARRRRWWATPSEAYVDRAQATSLRGIDVKIGHSPELGRPRRGPGARG